MAGLFPLGLLHPLQPHAGEQPRPLARQRHDECLPGWRAHAHAHAHAHAT